MTLHIGQKFGTRLSAALSRHGVCSRRDAKDYILSGRISVNGTTVTDLNFNFLPHQTLLLDGKPLIMEPSRLWMLNKPRGMLITNQVSDPRGRETLGRMLEKMNMANFHSVGRLDYTTEGLLLLTNSGLLKRHLELPENGFERKYRARVFGVTNERKLEELKKGVTIDGINYRGVDIAFEDESEKQSKNRWLKITLTEGKNREVKKLLKSVGLEVSKLIRTDYGPYTLGTLKEGYCMQVPVKGDLKKII